MASETANEINDWEWQKFKREFNLLNWNRELAGARRVGVALVGLGRMGLVHLRNLLREPRAKLLYCLDADQARLDACSQSIFFRELGIRALQADQLQVALADPEVHAVVIAAPTACHHQLVASSLEAGKSVLCEKPLSVNSGDILPLYALAKARRVFLMTAFNRHYDADWRRMRRLSAPGPNSALGAIQLIRIVSRNGQRPSCAYLKTSGGCFHDTNIHDLGMLLWLRRQLPASVRATGLTWKQYYTNEPALQANLSAADRQSFLEMDDDYFLVVITVQFGDGSIGLIDMARHSGYGNDQRCEIYGARGTLKSADRLVTNVVQLNQLARSTPGIHCTFESRYREAYASELEDFLKMANLALNGQFEDQRAIRETLLEVPRASLVAAAARIADACREAARTGQCVELEWAEEFASQFSREMEF